MPTLLLPVLAILACRGASDLPDSTEPAAHVVPLEASKPLERLRRASLALRGRPPSPVEVWSVHRGQNWKNLVASWRADPMLGEVVADVVAEALGVRHDAQSHVPPVGPLSSVPPAILVDHLDEAPLRLVAHIVNSGQPYTAILTTDEVLADPIVGPAYGIPVDPSVDAWQVSRWTDGRPSAGLLVSSTFVQRHPIAPTNHQRSRAAIVAEAFLCDDFTQRPEAGTFEPSEQDDAIREDPVCWSCHVSLDPLAANFEGFRRYILQSEVQAGYAARCQSDDDDCYPLALWDPDLRIPEGALPERGFYGSPTSGLADLGRAIIRDPRFAPCTVRRLFGHFTGLDWADVDGPHVQELAVGFAEDHDMRDLLVAMVTHDAFAPESPSAPPSFLRPRQWVRTVESLLEVTFEARGGSGYGPIRLVTTDRFGLNQVMGGVEGWRLVPPDRGPLPSRELGLRWLAEEAAALAVERSRSEGSSRWFTHGFGLDGPDARNQLVQWHIAILSEVVEPDDPAIDTDLALLAQLALDRDAETAWGLLLAAFLQHPRMVVQ